MADALAAAKAAALRDLFGTNHSTETKVNHEGSKKRPRSPADLGSGEIKPEGPSDETDFSPPTVPDVADEEKEQYSEVFEAMKRFAERGTADDEDEDAEATDANDDTSEKKSSEVKVEEAGEGKDAASGENTDVKEIKKSRREKKQDARNLIAKLKALAERPDVVDAWDVSAQDPLLLVHLKSRPSSVPVPANWRQKRKYLQNKRGMEKRAFILPSYIADTGVGALRDAQLQADDKKSLKQKQREKMRAKTGKGVEVDEVVMHDAFFKFQTKPRLTTHGDLYYELRELEVDNTKFRPGYLSPALRAALGVDADDPPPWLINMQRFGPPPGYPELKIPGLNAPIPPGAHFGYHPGGWGKPPVDGSGRPVYGDVFGEGREYQSRDARFDATPAAKKAMWGEMKIDVQFFKKSAESDAPSDAKEAATKEPVRKPDEEKEKGAKTAAADPSGATSVQVPALEAPADGIQLRKGVPDGALYTVVPEKSASVGKTDRLGSAYVYDLPGTGGPSNDADESEKNISGMETRERLEKKRRNENEANERSAKAQKSFKF